MELNGTTELNNKVYVEVGRTKRKGLVAMSSSTKKGRRVFVVGVGMSKFHKPKKNAGDGPHYPELANLAVGRALADACLDKGVIAQVASHW